MCRACFFSCTGLRLLAFIAPAVSTKVGGFGHAWWRLPRTLAQQAEDLKKLFFEPGGSIHEDAQFEYSNRRCSTSLGYQATKFSGAFDSRFGPRTYRNPGVRKRCPSARTRRADDRICWPRPSHRDLRDRTRHEAIFVSFGPGTGKTSFMISAAEALDEFAFIQTR